MLWPRPPGQYQAGGGKLCECTGSANFACMGISRTRPPKALCIKSRPQGAGMGLSGQSQTAKVRARRAAAPRLPLRRRSAAGFLSVLVLLLSAFITSWHQVRAQATANGIAELELIYGAELAASICHHEDDGTSQSPGRESLPCKEHCLLRLALQNTPALAPSGLLLRVQGGSTIALLPLHPARFFWGRLEPEQGRPRAPPLA